jgi:gliding motility-associated-like protein
LSTTIDAGIDVLNCIDKSTAITVSANTNGSNPLIYNWKNSQGTTIGNLPVLSINSPDIYTVEVSYDMGNGQFCKSSGAISITQDIKEPKVTAIIPTVRCKVANEGPKVLTLISDLPLTTADWKTPNGISVPGINIIVDSLNAMVGLPYTFHGIAANGCTIDTSFNIPTNFKKALVTVDGQMLTCFNPVTSLELTSNTAVNNISWLFDDGNGQGVFAGNSIIINNQDKPGTYTAKAITIESNCPSEGSKVILEDKIKPILELGESFKWYCNTNEIKLAPTNVEQGSNIIYDWRASNNGTILNQVNANTSIAASPGTYSLSIKNELNGCNATDSIKIIAETNVPNELNMGVKDITCFGQNDGLINVIGSSGGFEPFNYSIDGIAINLNDTKSNLKSGSYEIQVVDKYNCKYRVTILISEPPLLSVTTENELVLEYQEAIDIDFQSTYNINDISSIVWLDSKGNTLGSEESLPFVATTNELIELIVTNSLGCEARTKINIVVDNDLKLYFPNVFSPNGDGINDRLHLFKNKINAIPDYLTIYDRYGNMVYNNQSDFEFGDNDTGWDGKYNNSFVENGVYVIKLGYQDLFGQKHTVYNTVTILK